MDAMLGILAKLEEAPLRDMGDSELSIDIAAMNVRLQQLPDTCIFNTQENQMKKSIALSKLCRPCICTKFCQSRTFC